MEVKAEFWRGRRVLVTGHTGFKGSWLVALLERCGAEVLGISLPPATSPSHFGLLQKRLKVESLLFDIREIGPLQEAINRFQAEVVFHLAAQALVRESYRDPVGTFATNVMGTVHLLETCRTVDSVRSIVVVTSDKCYENNGRDVAFRETDRLGGFDPYSNSKACAELVSDSMRSSFFREKIERGRVGLATARAGNVIGGGDWSADRIIPDLVRAMEQGVPARIRNPGAVRPWQHVLDPLAGYLLLAEGLFVNARKFSSAWNFGPSPGGDTRSVGDLLRLAAGILGPKLKWSEDPGPHPHEAAMLKLDCEKAASELHWRPKWDVEETLKRTFEWYEAYFRSPSEAADMTFDQIESFGRGERDP